MVGDVGVSVGKDKQLVRGLVTSHYVVDDGRERDDLDETVYHIGEGLVRQEEKGSDNEDIRDQEHLAERHRPVLVDHQRDDISTSRACAVSEDESESKCLKESGDDGNEQCLTDIEELPGDRMDFRYGCYDLHGHRRHNDTIYRLETEAYAHGDNCYYDEQGVDREIGVLRRDQSSRCILDDGTQTHHSSSRHPVRDHERLPGDRKDETCDRQDNEIID